MTCLRTITLAMVLILTSMVMPLNTFAKHHECENNPSHEHGDPCNPPKQPKNDDDLLAPLLGGIAAGVIVGGIVIYWYTTDEDSEEFRMMLDESSKWIQDNTVKDERGLSFKVLEW